MQDLIHRVLKAEKKELTKIPYDVLQGAIGVPESVKQFFKTELPFHFPIPYSKEKIDEVVKIIKMMRRDISLLIPPEKLEPQSVSREDIIHLYVNKIIENHVQMVNIDSHSKDFHRLFQAVALQIHQNIIDEKMHADVFFQVKRQLQKKLIDDFLEFKSNIADFINYQTIQHTEESNTSVYYLGQGLAAEMLADQLRENLGTIYPEMLDYFLNLKSRKKNYADLTDAGKSFFELIVRSLEQDPLAKYLQKYDFRSVSLYKTFSEMDSDLFELNLGDNAEKIYRKNKYIEKIKHPYTLEMVENIHQMITELREDIKQNQDILDVIDEKTDTLTLEEKIATIFNIMRSYTHQFFMLCVQGYPYASDIKALFLSVDNLYDEIENPKDIYKKIIHQITQNLTQQFFETALGAAFDSSDKNAGFLHHAILIAAESSYALHLEKNILDKCLMLDQKTQTALYSACKEMRESKLFEQLNTQGKEIFKKIFKLLDQQCDTSNILLSPRSPHSSPRKEDLINSRQSSSSSSSSISSSPRTPAMIPRTVSFSEDIELIPKSKSPRHVEADLVDISSELNLENKISSNRFWKKN